MTADECATLHAAGPGAVFAVIQRLEAQVAALGTEVQELRRQLGGHSQNSHRPPAGDGPRKPPRSTRTPSGRRPGGQPGHPGHTLAMTATPDQVVAHHPPQCTGCGAALTAVPARGVIRRQVVDLPPLALEVTEHQAARVCCPHCRRVTTAPFPPDVAQPVQYGPRVLGLGVYLRHYQLLPYQRAGEALADLFGHGPAAGTLHRASLAGAAALGGVEAAIKAALSTAAVAHADETSVRVAGRRHWVHVVSTRWLTHYACHAKRGHAAPDAIGILPAFTGWLVRDGWASYWQYRCRHALCHAHHLRELAAVAEGPGQGWATDLRALLIAIKRHVARGRAAGQTGSPPVECAAYVARYRALLATGAEVNPPPERPPEGPKHGPVKQSPARNLLDRLTAHEDATLAFLHDWTVPFDNNQAERDRRMLKVQQKISGTFRDAAGAAAFCRIRGYIATLRKQAQPVLTALEQTFAGCPPLPALLPE